MNTQFTHETVLLSEAVDALNIRADGLYVDGTFGRGGHSALIIKRLNENGRLLVIDHDPEAIIAAQTCYANDPRVKVWQGSFQHIRQALQANDLPVTVDGVLLDLGVSSPQLDDASRGFSFNKDGALDMRMNPEEGKSAAEWLQTAKEAEIANVLWQYGEERLSRRIARTIVQHRVEYPLQTTKQLAELIAGCIPKREKHKHPATRSFQAIRIHINQELTALQACLAASHECLNHAARLVIISFHSLEDRIVKRFMRTHSRPPKLPRGLPIMLDETQKPILRLIGKVHKASNVEVQRNPRSRSAVMRVAEKQA
jgi:16S rRNA (cytosine1402-N4)-methyltransferase